MDNLPLFEWRPPRQVIPFPAKLRVGHARKVANLLAKARSQREAKHFLNRSVEAFIRQLESAGVDPDDIAKQESEYLLAIARECAIVRAGWYPVIEQPESNDDRGGAA